MSQAANPTTRASMLSRSGVLKIQVANTAPRSSLVNPFAIPTMQQYRYLSMKGDTPPLPKKVERSPVTQACHKLPEFKLQVSSAILDTVCLKDALLIGMSQATFLYHKLPTEQIPSGWSNNPVELEKALRIPVQDCGLDFKAQMPILVALAQDKSTIEWYFFENQGRFYLYYLMDDYVHWIMEPSKLEYILKKLAKPDAGGLETLLAGRVHSDVLDYDVLINGDELMTAN